MTRTKAEKTVEKIVPKENCIRFWKSLLFHDKTFIEISTTTIIESTIKHLEGGENVLATKGAR